MARVTLTQVGAFTTEVRDNIQTALQTAEAATKTATSSGVAGQLAFDGTNLYVCTAADVWHKLILADI